MHNYASLSASVSNIKMIFITHALPHPAQSFSNQWYIPCKQTYVIKPCPIICNKWHIPCKKTFVIKICMGSFGKGERFLFAKLLHEFILSSLFLLFSISVSCLFTPTFCKHWAWVAKFYQVWLVLLVCKLEDKRHYCQCLLHLLFFLLFGGQTTLQICISFCSPWLLRHDHLPQNMAYFSFLIS